MVFNDLGIEVLDNAFDGYHTCLFAYGQTGSGKSYSIFGYGENKGIIPLFCEQLFERIERRLEDPSSKIGHEVTVSMYEIYNETVQDLLIPIKKRPKNGLAIREHPKLGIYIENLTKTPVTNFAEIQRVMNSGTLNRTIGTTKMNATSSRAHTVTTIGFKQKYFHPRTNEIINEKNSNINLIDLAGSERLAGDDHTADRMVEGSNINRSLMILGKCIAILAKKSQNVGSKEVVPFRESKLTFILIDILPHFLQPITGFHHDSSWR